MVNFIESGFVSSGDTLPYISLFKTSNVLDTRDTCSNRVERSIYQISIHHETFRGINDLVDEVEDILDQVTLRVKNRRVLSTEFFEKKINELRPGLFRADLFYEVMAQRDFLSNQYTYSISEGSLSELLRKRFSTVTTTNFGHSSWDRPFIFVEGYNTTEAFKTTCSRLESTIFNVCVEDYNPINVEEAIHDIDDLLSYSRLEVRHRRWTSLEWLSDSLIEIEPNLWKGSITYEAILEKDLV